jgi:hypothetical protein
LFFAINNKKQNFAQNIASEASAAKLCFRGVSSKTLPGIAIMQTLRSIVNNKKQ